MEIFNLMGHSFSIAIKLCAMIASIVTVAIAIERASKGKYDQASYFMSLAVLLYLASK